MAMRQKTGGPGGSLNAKGAPMRPAGHRAVKVRGSRGVGTGGRVPADAVSVVSTALADRQQVCMTRLQRAGRRATEPSIHDLRVALRRLIAVLDLVEECTSDTGIPELRSKLRRILKRFNALRDVHIVLLALTGMQRSFPALRPFLSALRGRERVLVRSCAGVLRDSDAGIISAACVRIQETLLVAGAGPGFRRAAADLMRGSMARTYVRALRRLHAVRSDDPSSVHRLRVAFKRVRYSAEVLAPLLPWMTREKRKWMQEYQDLMGAVQDMEVMIAAVRRAASAAGVSRQITFRAVQAALAERRAAARAVFLQRAHELEHLVWPSGSA